MVRFSKFLPFLLFFFVAAGTLSAQELFDPNLDRNDMSVRPVRYADIMYKKTLWSRMDLRTKINEPFYAVNNELPRIIIDAVKEGLLRPYKDDSLLHRMTMDDFLKNLKLPETGGNSGDWDDDDGWDDDGDDGAATTVASDEYFYKDFSEFEIREDYIFDRRRSRYYYDIQAITIYLPGFRNKATGLEKPIGTFSYKELVDNVFKGNPKAIWYNPQNSSEHRNLSDAFDLRLFDSFYTKYNNPKDNLFIDIYDSHAKKALSESENYMYNLVERESHYWEN